MTKFEKIRQRTLSGHDKAVIAALADKADPDKGQAPVAEMVEPENNNERVDKIPATDNAAPRSIESLVDYYFSRFKSHGETAALSLANSAINMEAAAMITKAIKELKK